MDSSEGGGPLSSDRGQESKRGYRSTLRADQAADSRRRIVAAAADVFSERGYRGTHLRDIATAASVSVQLVNLNGPKPALLLAALEYLSVGGDPPQPISEIPEMRHTVESFTEPGEFIAWLARFATASNQRVAGIWQALEHAAAEEPDAAAAYASLIQRQRDDARLGVELLHRLAGQPPAEDLQQPADAMWAITLPDLYRRLVLQAHWSLDRYTTFIEEFLTCALLTNQERDP